MFRRTTISRRLLHFLCGAILVGCLPYGASAAGAADQAGKGASAAMMSASGEQLGTVQLSETPNGVLLQGKLTGIASGTHAFHIHETGACDAGGGFKSAGGHLAAGRKHGFDVADGPHPGDMTNVHVGADETLVIEKINNRVSFGGGPTGLFDGDGSAIVVHAGADDYVSQPSGAAGDRIACGVVKR